MCRKKFAVHEKNSSAFCIIALKKCPASVIEGDVLIGKFNVHLFFDGVDTFDTRARPRHFVFADEEPRGRSEGGNNFGMRLGQRNRLPHDACNARRGSFDKFLCNGDVPAENFRRDLSFVFGFRSISSCAGGKKNFFDAFGRKKFFGGALQTRRLDERPQSESFIVFLGVPASIRRPQSRRCKLDDFIFGSRVRRAGIDNFFVRCVFREPREKFTLAKKKYRSNFKFR